MGSHFLKTAFIVLPALVLILLLASCVAFACTRYSWRFNIFFLMLFTAGNLMPVQVIFQPLFQIYKRVPLPDFLSDTDTGNLLGTKYRRHPHPRRLPGRVLHVRAVELHEDDPQGALRSSRRRRCLLAPAVLQRDPPAHPPGAGGAGDARVHVAVQRLLLGSQPAQPGRRSGRSRRRSPCSTGSTPPTTTSSPPPRS